MLVSEREEMEQALLKQTSEEFDRIRESLDEEVRARQQDERDLQAFVREVVQNCQDKILHEKAERQKMEEGLIQLLE